MTKAEVAPGIYQLSLPIPAPSPDHVNADLVRGDRCLLVDTGWNTQAAFDALQSQLSEIEVSLEDISQIVITHIHPDHYGLAGRLKELTGARIALHYLEKDLIRSRYMDMDRLLNDMERWLRTNGTPGNEAAELSTATARMVRFISPTPPDTTLRGGEVLKANGSSFKVIWSPGHSPGQISLYEPRLKVLLSGDHILPDITPNIGRHLQSSPNPLGDYLDSLGAIKQLDIRLNLPGHGQPFTGVKERIEQIIGHHEQRKAVIFGILDMPKTAYQIATSIAWQDAGWNDLDSWGRRMAVTETLAHLEAMTIDGKLDRSTRDGVIYFGRKTGRPLYTGGAGR